MIRTHFIWKIRLIILCILSASFSVGCSLLGNAFKSVTAASEQSPDSQQASQDETVSPKEINDVLYNPGMGLTDFMGGEYTGGLPSPAAYPTPRIGYYRWYWYELEPVEGQYNFKIVEDAIAHSVSLGQKFDWRIMPAAPDWLLGKGVGQMGARPDAFPDHNHPTFLAYHEKLLKAFADRLKGNAHINSMDIGSVGCWGEWNNACCPAGSQATCDAYMPTPITSNKIVDWYFQYYPSVPLIALASGTGYANQKGAGWRGDCFGDYGMWGGGWNHMVNYYPEVVAKPEVARAWEKAPVAFESCGIMQDWYDKGFDIDLILAKGLEWHISVLNNKDTPIPAAWRGKINEWLKKVGYRFVLKKLTHATILKIGGTLVLDSEWKNIGVAPIYHAWPLAFRLRDQNDQGVVIFKSAVDLRKWKPGDYNVHDVFQIPDLATGDYSLDVAILDESDSAHIALAIDGKRSDLWYPISRIQLSK